jgi:hypothetical protein
MDPHQFGKLGLDPDPHQSEKQDPYPPQSEKVDALEGHFEALESPIWKMGVVGSGSGSASN